MNSFREYYFTENINWNSYINKSDELKYAVEVINIIKSKGYEALIVGGIVRDLLLGKDPHDVDISTNMPEDKIEELFTTYNIGKNKSFGVSVIKYKGYSYELAQYRQDFYTDLNKGKGADSVQLAKSFKDDSSRRDFTINSLGIDASGNIVDYHNGLDHIKNKIISTVGDPNLRFKEDQVRQLRGIRFSSKLGFKIDDKTIQAIKNNAPEIKKVASERIMKELIKMSEQSGDKFADSILMLKETGLLKYILPEIDEMDKYAHNDEQHPEGGVFEHTIAALRSYKGNDPVVNLCILIHDIGKIKTWSDGNHYYGHGSAGIPLIIEMAKRLKIDNNLKEAMIFISDNHMLIHDFLELSNNTIFILMQNPYWNILIQVAEADARSRGNIFDEDEWNRILQRIDSMKEKYSNAQEIAKIKNIVNGYKVSELTGIDLKKDGIKIGKIIKQTIQWILDNNIDLNNVSEIEDYIKGIKINV